jgi:hypothetical protein
MGWEDLWGRKVFYKYFVPTGLTEAEAKRNETWRQLNSSLDQSFLQFVAQASTS